MAKMTFPYLGMPAEKLAEYLQRLPKGAYIHRIGEVVSRAATYIVFAHESLPEADEWCELPEYAPKGETKGDGNFVPWGLMPIKKASVRELAELYGSCLCDYQYLGLKEHKLNCPARGEPA